MLQRGLPRSTSYPLPDPQPKSDIEEDECRPEQCEPGNLGHFQASGDDHGGDDHGHGGHSHGQANVDRALEASREGVRALKISMAALAGTAVPVMEAAVIHVDPCSHEVSHV